MAKWHNKKHEKKTSPTTLYDSRNIKWSELLFFLVYQKKTGQILISAQCDNFCFFRSRRRQRSPSIDLHFIEFDDMVYLSAHKHAAETQKLVWGKNWLHNSIIMSSFTIHSASQRSTAQENYAFNVLQYEISKTETDELNHHSDNSTLCNLNGWFSVNCLLNAVSFSDVCVFFFFYFHHYSLHYSLHRECCKKI